MKCAKRCWPRGNSDIVAMCIPGVFRRCFGKKTNRAEHMHSVYCYGRRTLTLSFAVRVNTSPVVQKQEECRSCFRVFSRIHELIALLESMIVVKSHEQAHIFLEQKQKTHTHRNTHTARMDEHLRTTFSICMPIESTLPTFFTLLVYFTYTRFVCV